MLKKLTAAFLVSCILFQAPIEMAFASSEASEESVVSDEEEILSEEQAGTETEEEILPVEETGAVDTESESIDPESTDPVVSDQTPAEETAAEAVSLPVDENVSIEGNGTDDKTTAGEEESATAAPDAVEESAEHESDESAMQGLEEVTDVSETVADQQVSLFDRLMACETLEVFYALAEETPEEELLALTEEQTAQIEEKISELEPEPLPELVIEESQDVTVPSEIVYPAVNFTNVAPFGDPVVG